MYRAIVTPIWWFLGIQYELKVFRRPNLQLLLEKILSSNGFWSSAIIYLQSHQQLDLQKMHGTRTRTRSSWFISRKLLVHKLLSFYQPYIVSSFEPASPDSSISIAGYLSWLIWHMFNTPLSNYLLLQAEKKSSYKKNKPDDSNGEHHMRSWRVVIHVSAYNGSIGVTKSQKIKNILGIKIIVR